MTSGTTGSSDTDYFNRVSSIRGGLVSKHRDDVPDEISENAEACAYYGVIQPYFTEGDQVESIAVETSLAIQSILDKHWKVDFWTDEDAKKATQKDIDDFLYDKIDNNSDISLTDEQMDTIFEETMRIAQNRRRT